MVGGEDLNEEEEKSDIPYGEKEKLSTALFFHSCGQKNCFLIVLSVIAGHFPCKAISKIVQLPTKEGYVESYCSVFDTSLGDNFSLFNFISYLCYIVTH